MGSAELEKYDTTREEIGFGEFWQSWLIRGKEE
jgi:hypothetical protein